VEQSLVGARPDEKDGSGEDALKVQLIIEAAIESWEKGTVVTLAGEEAIAISTPMHSGYQA
jgi:predicted dehydrogenase